MDSIEDADARGDLAAPVNLQLLAHVVNVVLHRRRFNSELPTNNLVRQPAFEQLRDL
jgi:hypothetical protein